MTWDVAYGITKETTMKNVLFLAPSYPYAKTVIENLHKELTRYDIPHTSSLATNNVYLKTDDVMVEFVHMDPIKYTPDIFMNRDLIFGKKVLIDKVHKTYTKAAYPIADCSIGKYLRDMYHYSRTRGVTVINTPDYKPRTTYLPEITHVYFNDPVTVVLWEDGTKTMVRCQEGDVYSPEVGLSLCITKKSLGNMPNFNNIFRKWIPEEEKTRPVNILLNIKNKDHRMILQALETNLQEFIKEWNDNHKRHGDVNDQLPSDI